MGESGLQSHNYFLAFISPVCYMRTYLGRTSALPWGLKFIVTNINEDFNNPQLGTRMHVFIHTMRKYTFHTLEKDFETDDEGS